MPLDQNDSLEILSSPPVVQIAGHDSHSTKREELCPSLAVPSSVHSELQPVDLGQTPGDSNADAIALNPELGGPDSQEPRTNSTLEDSPHGVPSAAPVDFGALFIAQVTQPEEPRPTHNAIGDELISRSVAPENYNMARKEREPYDEVRHKYVLIQEIIIRGSLSKACTALCIDYTGAYRDMKRDEGGFYDWDLIADEYRKQYLAADSRIFMRRIRKAVDDTMRHVDKALGSMDYDFKTGVWSEIERMVKTVRLLQDKSTENVDVRAQLASAVEQFKSKSDDERAAILEDLKRGMPSD